jgi:hypothetical protein
MIITEGDIRLVALIMEGIIVITAVTATGDMTTGTGNMTGEYMIIEITVHMITITGTEGYIMRKYTGNSVPMHLGAGWQ